MSDHGVFRRNGVPYLFLSCGRWEHYHQETDTPDRLNYQKMAAIAEYAENVCRSAADASLVETTVEAKSVEFEARTWKDALGLLHKPLAMLCGVPDFKSRSNIDRAAQVLTSML
jgi:hypothetical protein